MPRHPEKGYSPLLNWAERTGRIEASARMRWVQSLIANPEESERALLSAPANMDRGASAVAARGVRSTGDVVALYGIDDDPPWPWNGDHQQVAAALTEVTPGQTGYGTRESPMSTVIDLIPPPAGSKPTLFSGGDLPAVLASGAQPSLLSRVKFADDDSTTAARLNLAYAPTMPIFMALLEAYTGPDKDAIPVVLDQPGALQAYNHYKSRLSAWKSTPAPESPAVAAARARENEKVIEQLWPGGIQAALAPKRYER